MSKENVADGELSEEQRARISQKFRAAKALLSRKRPHDSANFSNPLYPINGDVETPALLTSVKRVPLSELNMNTPSPFSVKGLRQTDYKCENRSSCPDGLSVNRIMYENETPARLTSIKRVPLSESNMNTPSLFSVRRENRSSCLDGVSVNWTIDVPTKNGFFELDSFKTPMRQSEFSSVNDSLTCRNIILGDNDFDDSIFEEIDALCVQKSVESNTSEKCRHGNLDVQSQFDDKSKGEHKINMKPNAVEESLNAEPTLDVKDDTQSGAEQMENISMPEEYSKYLKSLNDRQREAACCDISIPLMIAAGPGSGKTATMVGRILMLLNEGIGPSNILAMTFTTAAASEMRERIGSVAGKAIAKELIISTFHSFSLQLCRLHADKLERTPEFLIFGHGQQRRAIIEAVRIFENEKSIQNHDLEKHGEDSTGNNFPQQFKDKSKKWQKFVTQAKACGKAPADCRKEGDDIGAMILGNYNDTLRTCNALDYHDLISCSVKLLTDFPEVFEECQKSWKAIVIDEFQDTSAMQYSLLRMLASHNCITIVGDDDQSIFSFNGADISGFDSFRKDFPNHKEVRLNKNYRSTRCIVEAASFVIKNNINRCQLESALTDNCSGSKITVKECQNEDAQCAFVVDKILEIASDGSAAKCSFGNIAILYRRQVSGKVFQTVFRGRRIPFNMHGVAFYRKKVVKAIMAMLRTTLPGCDDGPYRQAFKALLPFDKEGRKRVTDHIEKISTIRKCSFLSAACDIFAAKISGTFKRSELTQGRKVLVTLEMISKLARREQSISAVLTSVANMLPQKYLLEKQAVVDVDGGKLLNEDNDLRSVLQYLLDDVSEFLSTQFSVTEEKRDVSEKEEGCLNIVKAFVDYTTERERENFRSRRLENRDSVTLTTIHQSKGLEWDTVFIAKANESEIPLLHEFNGIARQNAASIEEERRLFYVAMTRARKKLFILYVTVDSNWQMLQPSRFLKEIPGHLRETQADLCIKDLTAIRQVIPKEIVQFGTSPIGGDQSCKADVAGDNSLYLQHDESLKESIDSLQACNGNNFLKRFRVEDRGVVSHLFHQWARKKAFQDPKRLIDKVGFVIDERLTVKKNKHKDLLRALKTCLRCEEAFLFAQYVLRWEQIPADKRAHLMREKQEHFQKLRIENAMGSSAPTTKQIAFLQNLGCTVAPTSRLHASHLIEQYKSL